MPYLGHPFRVLITCGKVLACAHVFWTQFYSIGWGQGPSMIPTFLVTNEAIIISKRYRRGRGVQVGDIIDYDIPVEPGQEGVKRVLGMPGDYVLLNSPGSKNDNMVQVPRGHCYIIGDNMPWSRDSRDFGPIPLALIKGKVISKGDFSGWNPLKWFRRLDSGLTPEDSPGR